MVVAFARGEVAIQWAIGLGGSFLTITGTGFLAGATVTVAGVAARGVTVVSSTTITCSTPPAAVAPRPRSLVLRGSRVESGRTHFSAGSLLPSLFRQHPRQSHYLQASKQHQKPMRFGERGY